MKILSGMNERIGDTPLIKMGNIYCKCECFNPTGSIKDRTVAAMIEDALDTGQLERGGTIVMASTGLSAVSLAAVGASYGLRVKICATESISPEIEARVRSFGAETIILSDGRGMKSAIAKAEHIAATRTDAVFFNQFENPACVAVHRDHTGVEIWQDTEGSVDVFVAGVGTAASIMGVAKLLKHKNPAVKIFAVEPAESAVLSGGSAGIHRLSGIGAGFIPPFYDKSLVDGVIGIKSEEAEKCAEKLQKSHGVPFSAASGAVYLSAEQVCENREFAGKVIVALLGG
jgi:cysteine synthase A